MIYTPLTNKAMKLCFEAHMEQTDKNGIPYVFHPFHLAEQMNDEITTIAALLHDIIEDTPITADELLGMGFPARAVDAVRLLTHDDDVPYDEYISAIKNDPVAMAVKLADLRHNSDISRIEKPSEKDVKRAEKYRRAIAMLENRASVSDEQFIVLDKTYLPEMAELYKNAFGREPWNDDWSCKEQLMQYMREISCAFNSLNYGLIINGRLSAVSVGMIRHWWMGTNYNIEEFCVSPDMQGNGIGSRFMAMICEDIKKRGLNGIFLQTDNDKPSYGFYKKNGFTELDAHVSFYRNLISE